MAMTKPIGKQKNAFDADVDQIFEFEVYGGDQVVANKIIIKNQATGEVVYEDKVQDYRYMHTVPHDTLTNGMQYSYSIITYDANDNASTSSDVIQFYCFTSPYVTINLPNPSKVTSATLKLEISYSQEEGELPNTCKIYLENFSYGSTEEIGDLYFVDNKCYCTLNDLEDETSYQIRVVVTTVHGMEEEEYRTFYVRYKTPSFFSNLKLTPKCDDGYLEIESNILQILPETKGGEFVDDDTKYALGTTTNTGTNCYAIWKENININKDFAMQLVFNPVVSEIFSFTNKNGEGIVGKVEDFLGNSYVVNIYIRKLENGELKEYLSSTTFNSCKSFRSKLRLSVVYMSGKAYGALSLLEDEDIVFNWGESNVALTRISGKSLTNPFNILTEDQTQQIEFESIEPFTVLSLFSGIFDSVGIKNLDTAGWEYADVLYFLQTFGNQDMEWDDNTTFLCEFNGSLEGGNVDFAIQNLTEIKLKKKIGYNKWVTLYSKKVTESEDINFYTIDAMIPSGKNIQYAIVPVLNNGNEGTYYPKTIKVDWSGIFVTAGYWTFKLYNGASLGNGNRNQQVGSLQPIGSKYPYINSNSIVNYYSGTVSGSLCGYDFEKTRKIDRNDVVNQTNDFLDLVTYGGALIIKDWNGNIWLAKCTDKPSVSYNSNYGSGVANVSFSFSEIGDINNEEDLTSNGIIY